MNAAITGHDLDAARASVANILKFDIITVTQDFDNEQQIKEISRSFVSDTITAPTKEMYTYATKASMGDDVYHEPSTAAFEAHVAKITGKEAALFLPSGTMSNQIALRTHLVQPPYSVLCDHRAHIHKYEAGGTAFHSGAAVIPVIPSNGHHMTLDDIKSHLVEGGNIHYAPTEVIELENTLNGTILPQNEVIRISEFTHQNGIKLHLDGARIWHVAAVTGKPLSELLAPFDSASLCFSKGLGAPIGSCLVGSNTFIARARWFRKLFGGGMRQTGILAASAAYALSNNFARLIDVHNMALRLEQGLTTIGCKITSPAETCMIFYDPSPIGVSYEEIATAAANQPIPIKVSGSRLVVHLQTAPEAIDEVLAVIQKLADEKCAAGFVPSEKTVKRSTTSNIYQDVCVLLKE